MIKIWKNSKVAILVTLVIHVAFILFMSVSKMEVVEYIPKHITLIELDFSEEEKMEPEEKEIIEEEFLEQNDQSYKDLARDIADIRKKSRSSYSEAELEAELLKEIQDRNKEEVKKRVENGKGFDKTKFDLNETINKTKVKESTSLQAEGKVTVTCNVPNRKCYIQKKPTFVCEAGGKVYVEIKVDKIGRVKKATINNSKSTTTNQCLLKNALEYAKDHTKVKADLKGGNSSAGYIIYNFIKQ